MKRALLLVLALGACSQSNYPGLTGIHRECGYDRVPFDESWACVKVGVRGAETDQDLIDQYTSLGDVVAERVRAGQMTDAEAKAVMADARTRINNAAAARAGVSGSGGGYRPTVYQRVGNTGTVIAY